MKIREGLIDKVETNTWWSIVWGIILFYMGIILLGFAIVDASLQNLLIAVFLILAGILTPLFTYYWHSAKRRRETHRIVMRQAAAAGDTSVAPLVNPQPLPGVDALALPFIIQTRPNWLSLTPVCACAALLCWGMIETLPQSTSPPEGGLLSLLFFALVSLAFLSSQRLSHAFNVW